MSLAHLLLLLLASLLMGCPDRGGADATADALDAAEEEGLDAKDDLAADRADARRDARRDASAPDAPMDAEHDRLDAEEEAPDSTVATDGSVEAALDAARCDPDARVPCRCFHGVSGAHYCHRSGRMGACLCVRGEADGGVRPLPPRLVAPLSASRVTSQRPTLRWVPPSGVERSVVELCRDRACTRRLAQEEVRGNAWRPTSALTPGITFWRVRGLAADGGVTWSSATWSFSVKHRDAPTDTSTHPLRDFNGDGYDDVAVVSGGYGSPRPLLVYHGSASGLRSEPGVSLTPPEFDATRSESSFGSDGTVGDFNGDGYGDLAIGEPTYRPAASSSDRDYGHVHMYWGGPDGISAVRTQRLAVPAEELDPANFWFGTAVGAVDFDGDGFDDLLTLRSAYAEFPRVHFFRGRPSGVESTPTSTLHSEESINTENPATGVGDVDGDGYGDFAIGLPRARIGRNQSLVVVYGNPDGDLGRRVELHEADSRLRLYIFSSSLRGGDYNGDGFADIACGSWNVIQIAYGTSEGIEVDVPLQSPMWGSIAGGFGQYLQIQGDMDGDGRTDLTSGGACENRFASPAFPCWYGVVHLFRSTVSGVMHMWDRLIFPYYGSNDGGFVRPASPGDVNGDGIDDLLVGTYGAVPPDAGAFPEDVLRGAIHGYLGGRWDWTRPSFTVRSPQIGIEIGGNFF